MPERKRFPRPRAKPGELMAYYGKLPNEAPDFIFSRGDGVGKPDGHLLYNLLCYRSLDRDVSFVEELERRGYDTTTLRFSVRKKEAPDAE